MTPQLLVGKVFHKRLFPAKNAFHYGIYYLTLPIDQISALKSSILFGINRFGLLSFYNKDHINPSNQSLEQWKSELLKNAGITEATGQTILVTMPRVIGYIFNPVSFWLCLDKNAELRAVICAVSNTYGEKHYYLCAHSNQQIITANDTFCAKKVFHVSPFIAREGSYQFSFSIAENSLSISINYYDANSDCLLVTSLQGNLIRMTHKSVLAVFLKYPLVTLVAITRIHWQALKLFIKKIKFIDKPKQHRETITRSS